MGDWWQTNQLAENTTNQRRCQKGVYSSRFKKHFLSWSSYSLPAHARGRGSTTLRTQKGGIPYRDMNAGVGEALSEKIRTLRGESIEGGEKSRGESNWGTLHILTHAASPEEREGFLYTLLVSRIRFLYVGGTKSYSVGDPIAAESSRGKGHRRKVSKREEIINVSEANSSEITGWSVTKGQVGWGE